MNRSLYQYRADRERGRKRAHRLKWLLVFAAAAFVMVVLAQGVLPADAHDMAAWSDPARDQWFRSLQIPNGNVSCCNFTDGSAFDPDKVRQAKDGSWWIDLGKGYVQVPPERVVETPISIDGLPYLFMMQPPNPMTPERIRCFVPPVGTY